MQYNSKLIINNKDVATNAPVYFIADIAANHDGDLSRAKNLIWLAKEAGADAAKFQHFQASKIVSDYGFKHLGASKSHQSSWKKSVYEVYKQYECRREWSEELVKTAQLAGIEFMTTPYDESAVELLDKYVSAYKIGSGDITCIELIQTIAKKQKPVILATGASTMQDIERAVAAVVEHNPQIALLQCNTNYTANLENFRYINLRVLEIFKIRFPNMVLGLSDHTIGHSTVLGAIALGARIIEKHFTDDNDRNGPDHHFAMTPKTWSEMVARSRELELALGSGIKVVEENELETLIVQRRCIRMKRSMHAGEQIYATDLECLRPAPSGSLEPYRQSEVIGKTLTVPKEAGEALYFSDFGETIC